MVASWMNNYLHTPVLLAETVNQLITDPQGIYVDATFGRGNHTQAILSRLNVSGRVIALDKDPEAIAFGKQHFANEKRLQLFHQSFANLKLILESLKLVGQVNGILFDLGVSSPQLDDATRGFSFSQSGKLDMRMDNSQGMSAAEWLTQVEEKELANVLYRYGEEKWSRRIAKAIVHERETTPITTTTQLANIILRAMPKRRQTYDKHPATRCFQAIRIVINQELQGLELGLQQALAALKAGGRLVVISFHSLEDRVVKQFIRDNYLGQALPRGLPIQANVFQARLKPLTKPIKPSKQEVNENPRSRSAILRVAEKKS